MRELPCLRALGSKGGYLGERTSQDTKKIIDTAPPEVILLEVILLEVILDYSKPGQQAGTASWDSKLGQRSLDRDGVAGCLHRRVEVGGQMTHLHTGRGSPHAAPLATMQGGERMVAGGYILIIIEQNALQTLRSTLSLRR